MSYRSYRSYESHETDRTHGTVRTDRTHRPPGTTRTQAPRPAAPPRRTLAATGALLVLGAWLRLRLLDGSSLWSDEGNSWAMLERGYGAIARAAGQDIHPPGYYWLLKVWSGAAGSAAAGIRSLSALAGLLMLALLPPVARRLGAGRGAGLSLLALALAAVNPFLVSYSQEARMYSLLALESTLLFLAALGLTGAGGGAIGMDGSGADGQDRGNRGDRPHREDRAGQVDQPVRHDRPHRDGRTVHVDLPDRGDRPALRDRLLLPHAGLFALASAAGLWTHYSFPVLLAAANLYLLLVPRPRRLGRRLIRLGLLNLPALLLFLPWLPTAWRAVRAWPAEGARPPLAEALATIARSLAYGPLSRPPAALMAEGAAALSSFGIVPPAEGASVWDSLAGAGLALALLLPLAGLWRLRRQPSTLALALWLLAPVTLLLGRGLVTEAYLKILLAAAPAWCLASAAALSGPREVARAGSRAAGSAGPAGAAAGEGGGPGPASWRWRAKVAGGSPGALALTVVAGRLAGAMVLALAALLPAGLALADYYRPPGPRDDYAGVAAELRRRGDAAEDAVLLCGPGQAEVWRYYDPGLPVLALPAQRPPDAARTLAALEAGLAGRRELTALWWGQDQADPEGILEGWLNRHAFLGPSRWARNLRVARYALAAPADCRPPSGTAVSDVGLRLLATCLEPLPALRPGRLLPVLLRWRAAGPLPLDYAVSLQLLSGRSTPADPLILVAQQDGQPAGGARPMRGWAPGETVEDRRALALPEDGASGPYRLRVVVYDPADGRRVDWGGGDYVEVAEGIGR